MDQALIDQIVNLVIDRLQEKLIAAAPSKHVLMLFSGAGSGYMVGMQAIRCLSKAGHPLTVVMTPSARHVIGEDKVRGAGATCLIGDSDWVSTPKLVREIDMVIMPTLSMNTAARLASGLMDSLITTLTLGSLLAGKPVMAVCDGANPYGHAGRVFGESNAPAPRLREKLADHLTTLMDYGMQLVKEEDFMWSLIRQLHGAASQAPLAPSAPAPAPASNTAAVSPFTTRPGEMITAGEMQNYPRGATIRLAAGARLTPLAQEVVFHKELRLVHE